MRVMEQAAQRCGWCPIPGDIQGKAGSGPGLPDLAVHIPSSQGSWTGWLLKVPSNAKGSMILYPQEFSKCTANELG